MTIFIAPIGKKTDHVKNWLKEKASDVEILWLIHSKKDENTNFPAIAKKLENDLSKAYPQIQIKKKVNSDPFTEDPTIDAILEIIREEEDNEPSLIRKDFVVNITGGTNIIAAATILAATFYGTRAHYVREPQPGDSRKTKYVYELPIQPIGTAKYNQNQLDVLKIIAESVDEITDTPEGLDSKKNPGCIKRLVLLEKLGWDTPVKTKSGERPEGGTRLRGITKKLEADGFIKKIKFVESYYDENFDQKEKTVIKGGYTQKVENEDYRPSWKIKQDEREVRFEITPSGKRKARDFLMFDLVE